LWESIITTPGNAEFVQQYSAKYNRPIDYHAATGYSGGMVLEAAVKQVGGLDREKIRDALATIRLPTLLPGEYRVDETGAQQGHIMMSIQIQDGKRVVIAPKESATGSVMAPTPAWNSR
jgi:branched-chain amino acid transport system substrate-binding protein